MGENNKSYVNKHGRKPGRGTRPWLLIPKVLMSGAYLGSLIATGGYWYFQRYCSIGEAAISDRQVVEFLSLMFRFVAVPALLAALLLGGLLWLQHPRVFLKMRWLQVKLLVVAVSMTLSHFFMSSRLHLMRESCLTGQADGGVEMQISLGLAAVVVITAAVIWLGRHKPRLGQNWAKAHDKVK